MHRIRKSTLLSLSLAALCLLSASVRADVINFDDLATSVVVTNQYPQATFSSIAGSWVETAGDFGLGSSPPNYICTTGICADDMFIDFTNPISNLTFLALRSRTFGVAGVIDVYQGGALTATIDIIGTHQIFTPIPIDLSSFGNVTSITIRNIISGDGGGLAFDDFTFTVEGANPVPEPTTMLLLGTGLAGLGGMIKRRRQGKD